MADLALPLPVAQARPAVNVWIAPPLLVLAALFLFPLALIVRQALAGDGNALSGTVRSVVWQGDLQSVELDVDGHVLRMSCAPMHEPPPTGASLRVHFSATQATLVPETLVRG